MTPPRAHPLQGRMKFFKTVILSFERRVEGIELRIILRIVKASLLKTVILSFKK